MEMGRERTAMKVTILYEVISHDGEIEIHGIYVNEKVAKKKADERNALSETNKNWGTETHDLIMDSE